MPGRWFELEANEVESLLHATCCCPESYHSSFLMRGLVVIEPETFLRLYVGWFWGRKERKRERKIKKEGTKIEEWFLFIGTQSYRCRNYNKKTPNPTCWSVNALVEVWCEPMDERASTVWLGTNHSLLLYSLVRVRTKSKRRAFIDRTRIPSFCVSRHKHWSEMVLFGFRSSVRSQREGLLVLSH